MYHLDGLHITRICTLLQYFAIGLSVHRIGHPKLKMLDHLLFFFPQYTIKYIHHTSMQNPRFPNLLFITVYGIFLLIFIEKNPFQRHPLSIDCLLTILNLFSNYTQFYFIIFALLVSQKHISRDIEKLHSFISFLRLIILS